MTPERVEELLDRFPHRKIALVGDLFLDRYLDLTSDVEYSIETGLEAYQIERVRNAPGALGTVINNLAALGVGHLMPVTVIGDDGHGIDLRRSLATLPNVDLEHVIADPERMTPTYTKPMRPDAINSINSSNLSRAELNRLDFRTRAPMSSTTTSSLVSALRLAWEQCEGLIVLDQISEPDCGVVCLAIREELRRLAFTEPDRLMMIDSREFSGAFGHGILKGNRRELIQASCAGLDATTDDASLAKFEMPQVLDRLKSTSNEIRQIFCTDGPEGIWVADQLGIRLVGGHPVAGPIDIVGAGDTVTSALMASLLSGAASDEAAAFANLAASISIRKLGQTGVATPDELLEAATAT